MIKDDIYAVVDRLKEKGKVANVWGGCEDDFTDPDGSVLSDLLEYIGENYEDLNVTDWIEAIYQILNWQYQSMHEGVTTYYSNFYGGSEYPLIVNTAVFLKEKGYLDIYEQYNSGLELCKEPANLKEINPIAKDIDAWINWHTKEVWECVTDILLKHREEWSFK